MPRLPTSLLRKAYAIDTLLPSLLGPCRELHAAQNELRWLREHVENVAKARRRRGDTIAKRSLLSHLVKKRARGKPLQYILGTEFFGDLEIRCRPGVLIPRQDTAASISHLAHLLGAAQKLPSELRVLDLCTGTGCIPLLFQHQFFASRRDVELRLLGVDVSENALNLAFHNLQRIQKNERGIPRYRTEFLQGDVLVDPLLDNHTGRPPLPLKTALNLQNLPRFWDLLISNPPYISPSAYWKTTTRSVRGYEPKLALVPPNKAAASDTAIGDTFYPRLLVIAQEVEAKIVLLEIADFDQALRVAQQARKLNIFDGIEIWKDTPGVAPAAGQHYTESTEFPVIGQGNVRSVFCWRGKGGLWLGRQAVSEADDALRLLHSLYPIPL